MSTKQTPLISKSHPGIFAEKTAKEDQNKVILLSLQLTSQPRKISIWPFFHHEITFYWGMNT